ncbi:MAG TPA: polysaccharide deacetylase family protein [Polyangiales bacterium]|nr:polysaccharide deacetylase family protein [Polyangiales bacterium]
MPFGSKANRKLCAISVDLDEIPCYTAIHGLSLPLSEAAQQAVYRKALPRLAALFDAHGVRGTWFAIGRDLEQVHASDALRALAAKGHEIGNHSYSHRYDLTRMPEYEMRADVARGIEAVERAVGQRPRGFRAPGYTFTDTLSRVLQDLEVSYDSSVFPCPGYYAPKLLAIGAYRLLGRPTRSIPDHPRVLTASGDPYRMGDSYTRRGNGLLELPVGVTRDHTGRLPFIGTSLTLAGRAGAQLLCRLIEGRELINLELHGIDASDAVEDELTSLREAQPDLRRSAATKLDILGATLEHISGAGYSFVTLAEAAEEFARVD